MIPSSGKRLSYLIDVYIPFKNENAQNSNYPQVIATKSYWHLLPQPSLGLYVILGPELQCLLKVKEGIS